MPIITVSLFTGRTQREKDRLAETITKDVCKVLNVEKKDVIIVFQETLQEIGTQKVSAFKISLTHQSIILHISTNFDHNVMDLVLCRSF